LLSVLVMEDNDFAVEFKNQQVLIRLKESSPNITQVIWVREGNLYRLQGETVRALVHNSDSLCELWHKRMGHLHHKALPIPREIVIGLPKFNTEQHGVCKGCTLGKHAKVSFPSSERSEISKAYNVCMNAANLVSGKVSTRVQNVTSQ
jgi:hypothetical protein